MPNRITHGFSEADISPETTLIVEAISPETAQRIQQNPALDADIVELESPTISSGMHQASNLYAMSYAQPVLKTRDRDVSPISFTGLGVNNSIVDDTSSQIIFAGTGLQLARPRYPLLAVHRYLLGNPWHFTCVMAKAGAATELGYDWVSSKTARRGIVTSQSKRLIEFEDRLYERTHKDLPSMLKEVSIDFFSTGNMNMELQYTMGGLLDCMYSIPAVTCFRHAHLPLGVQCLSENQALNSYYQLPLDVSHMLGVQAVMPLFMSGLTLDQYQDLIPEYQRTHQVGYSEMLHETNSILSTDPVYGIADILPALAALLGDNAATDYNLQFFENNAVPRYAVTISGGRVTDKVKQDIVTFLDKHIRGKNHRTIVIPLPTNVSAKFEALDSKPAEGSFISYKKINREEIAAVHKVPPSEIGLWENSNKANSSQQAKNYFLKVIQPFQARLERMMNRAVRSGLKISNYQFKFRNVEYTDDQERATVQDTLARAMQARTNSLTQAITTVQTLLDSEKPVVGKDSLGELLNTLVTKLKDIDTPLDS